MLAVNDGHGNIANASVNVTVRDTTPPVVTPPAAITVAATEAGGTRGNASATLAAFLAGGTAADIVDRSPTRLAPQVSGLNVDANTLFAVGSTTPVLFRFRDANGNVGTATSNVSVVLGTPRITGFVAAKGLDPSGAHYVDVRLTNTGTGNARNLKITLITPRMLSGIGTVTYNSSLSPPLPVAAGNLDVGSSATFRLFLGVPSTVTKFSVTESGSVQDVLGTNYNYSTAEAVYP
jgi:von Willebrand factor A domain-containing protein 7